MRRSKYVGMELSGGWKVVNFYLAGTYCGGTRHNAYRYQLARVTSDGKFDKIITLSGTTLRNVIKNGLDVNAIVENKKKSKLPVNEVLYKFKTKKEQK